MQTTEVENFPGFRDGVMGPDLMDAMRAQAERFGAELVPDDIVEVDLTGAVKTVMDSSGTVHRAKAVIVATGSQHRTLGLPGEAALSGRGVSKILVACGLAASQPSTRSLRPHPPRPGHRPDPSDHSPRSARTRIPSGRPVPRGFSRSARC